MAIFVGSTFSYPPSWQLHLLFVIIVAIVPPAILLVRRWQWRFSLRFVLAATAVFAANCAAINEDLVHAFQGELWLRSADWKLTIGLAGLAAIFSWAIAQRWIEKKGRA